MKITVIGTGYVGLTTAVSLAYMGHQVCCIDRDAGKLKKLLAGKAPFYEPGLDAMLQAVRPQMRFVADMEAGIEEADAIFLAVGTPQKADGSPDLNDFWSAVNQLLKNCSGRKKPLLLVNKSTVPVGTGRKMVRKLSDLHLNNVIHIASNPEFLRQGRALYDNLYPYRFVFGGDDVAHEILRRIYQPIIIQQFAAPASFPRPDGMTGVPFYCVDLQTSEMAKYAANAFLAMKISFINEMANIAELSEADVTKIAAIIGEDERIGSQFLNAGIGYGGSCFPKDTRALKYMADASGYDFKLMSAVIDVNNQQKYRLLHKLRREIDVEGAVVAVLGLTFKPETDDLREAPSIPIIHELVELGAQIRVHDPVALHTAAKLLPSQVYLCESIAEALTGADAVLVLTEWPQYCTLNQVVLRETMRGDLILDGRNCLQPEAFPDMHYLGVGRTNLPGHADKEAAVAI